MTLFLVALLLAGQYAPVTKYDPARSPEQDLKDAVVEAQRTGKRILLEVGESGAAGVTSWTSLKDPRLRLYAQLPEPRGSHSLLRIDPQDSPGVFQPSELDPSEQA